MQGFYCRGGITGPEEGLHLYAGDGLPLNTIQIVLIDLAFTCLCIPKGGIGWHCLESNIIGLKSSNILMFLQHGKLVC